MMKRTPTNLRLLILAYGTCIAVTALAEDAISIQFNEAEVGDVITSYQRLTGFHVVVDPEVVGPITLSTTKRVSKEKAIELIEQTLFAAGYGLIQTTPDTVRIPGFGKGISGEVIPVFKKLEDLPKGERIVRYVYKFQHRAPKDVLAILQRNFTPNPSFLTPSFDLDESVDTLIITDRTSSLKEMIKLLGELDQAKTK
jgi:type II secretory pathway component GspD/PulD (secretin)